MKRESLFNHRIREWNDSKKQKEEVVNVERLKKFTKAISEDHIPRRGTARAQKNQEGRG